MVLEQKLPLLSFYTTRTQKMLSPVKHIYFCIMSPSSEETAFSFNFHHIQLLKYYSFLAARQKYAIQPVTLPHLAPFK